MGGWSAPTRSGCSRTACRVDGRALDAPVDCRPRLDWFQRHGQRQGARRWIDDASPSGNTGRHPRLGADARPRPHSSSRPVGRRRAGATKRLSRFAVSESGSIRRCQDRRQRGAAAFSHAVTFVHWHRARCAARAGCTDERASLSQLSQTFATRLLREGLSSSAAAGAQALTSSAQRAAIRAST
jgi:hypothetical protein